MKKFTLKGLFSVLMVMILVLVSACGGSDSSSDKTGSNRPSDETSSNRPSDVSGSETVKSVELKMGHMTSTNHVQHSMAMVPFAEEVAKVTENQVNFTIYPGAALAGPAETYDAIITGIMDAGWGLQGYTAGKFPVHSVLHLPFLADGTGEELSVVAQKLYDKFPEIQKEYADVKPLWFHAADPYAIITKEKAVRSFADVKGLKLRAPSVEAKSMIESWGATPVSFPAPDIYDSLQKGVIDGAVLPIAAIKDFNLVDVIDYVAVGNFNTSLFFEVMNKDSWNKLSPEIQKKIDELIGLPMAREAGKAFDFQAKKAEKESKAAGVEFISLPDAELQLFKDASKIVTDKWISDMEAKGIPGQNIYDETVKLIEGN